MSTQWTFITHHGRLWGREKKINEEVLVSWKLTIEKEKHAWA